MLARPAGGRRLRWQTVTACAAGDAGDPATLECRNACQVAADTKRSVGCEYYATFMDTLETNGCFATFVANTSTAPAKLTVSRGGAKLDASEFAYREIKSEAPFGVWVWGWSPPMGTQFFSGDVSYGYPAGMSIRPMNDVESPVIK